MRGNQTHPPSLSLPSRGFLTVRSFRTSWILIQHHCIAAAAADKSAAAAHTLSGVYRDSTTQIRGSYETLPGRNDALPMTPYATATPLTSRNPPTSQAHARQCAC